MKFAIEWLRTWVDIPDSVVELTKQLTQIGFEVENVIDEKIIDLAIPPNRGDCLSIMGIARELAVLNRVPLKPVTIPEISAKTTNSIAVNLQAKECSKYLARTFKQVNVHAKTPVWLEQRLIAAGINCISAVVDITNYVMLELGQPMHAFALSAIANEIVVRPAKQQESLVLLDNTKIFLQAEDLVIADQSKVLALAGVMGGLASSITEDSQDILLECANFSAINIRATARRHNLASESSFRFARTVDPQLAELALARATALLQEITAAQPGPIITALHSKEQLPVVTIMLRKARIAKILTIAPDELLIVDILTRLGMVCETVATGWQVTVPSYRTDLTLEIDLIEEIARFIGYDNIPAVMPTANLQFKPHAENIISELQVKTCLQYRGYNEVITYSFIAPELAELFVAKAEQLILTNPISADLAVMRPTLWPSLLQVVQYNKSRQCDSLRIFELGLKFKLDEQQQLQQTKVIAGLAMGKAQPEHWDLKSKDYDFFDLKGDIEALAKLAGNCGFSYKARQQQALHPGKSAAIYKGEQHIGYLGELHPKLLKTLAINEPILVFEIDFAALTCGKINKFCCISKFPGIRRDLAIIVEQQIVVCDLVAAVTAVAGNLLQDIVIFDLYCGKGIEHGKKSVGLGIILQHPSRTMVEEEITQVMGDIIKQLKLQFNAILR